MTGKIRPNPKPKRRANKLFRVWISYHRCFFCLRWDHYDFLSQAHRVTGAHILTRGAHGQEDEANMMPLGVKCFCHQIFDGQGKDFRAQFLKAGEDWFRYYIGELDGQPHLEDYPDLEALWLDVRDRRKMGKLRKAT